MQTARVTDAVEFFRNRGEMRGAVRAVKVRTPEKLRWRDAMSRIAETVGRLGGRDRHRVEEPVRELVLDLKNIELQREVVLDAWRNRVDLDRGEILPFNTMADLRRAGYLIGTPIHSLERALSLPVDFGAPIDTATVVLMSRAMAAAHRRRAHQHWLELPDESEWNHGHIQWARRAKWEADQSLRWTALSESLLRLR